MAIRTALISGAGIAGSAVAYWLARSGWEVTMVEKARGTRSSGNPIDVRGEATMIANAMGIWPKLAAAATGVTRLVFVDGRGRHRATIDTRQSASDRDEVEVPRADLAAALLEAATPDAELLQGDSIATLHQDADGVDVEFETATPRRFDLVFGADGLHSNVRRLTFGAESTYSRPLGMFVGTVRTNVDIENQRHVLMLNEPGRSLSVHPAGGSPLAAFIFRSREPFDYRDSAAGKRLVAHAYADVGWVSDQVLAEWQASEDIYFDAVSRITMPTWTRGRISLVGDAADCLSLFGEGSSNAIVAAKTLADALMSHSGDHAIALALAEYEATHRRRLSRFRRGAYIGSHFLVPASGPGIALRNAGVRIANRLIRK